MVLYIDTTLKHQHNLSHFFLFYFRYDTKCPIRVCHDSQRIHRQITTKKNTLFLIFVYSWQQTDQNLTNSIKSLEVRKFLSTRFNFNPNSETCTDIKLTGQWSSWDMLLTFSRPFTGSGAYGVCKQRCSVYRSCCFHFCCYMSHQRLLQASDGLSLVRYRHTVAPSPR